MYEFKGLHEFMRLLKKNKNIRATLMRETETQSGQSSSELALEF